MASRQSIKGLYRRCIQSANRIPDAGQRQTYLDYVRDGFRRKANLPRDTREAVVAFKDGLDQVVDMEYYQKMAMIKNKNSSSTNSVGIQSAVSIGHVGASTEGEISTAQPSEIVGWLKSQLPHLRAEDAKRYSKHLIDDGFDSVDFIMDELGDEDLDFMKKAHRRVIVRHLEKHLNR
ncbi:hypothetical protein ACHAWO_004872 [Cyclotella atomus]|uniref:Complex 1 LYR protein domain-containing protein n=1 Tax=Cyclotella atomus TaxID=382360 RepID=A0ABD3NBP0_9STRA